MADEEHWSSADRIGEPFDPPNLSLLPDPLLRQALLIIGVPLVLVLTLAIHPWTFGSAGSSGSSGGYGNSLGGGQGPYYDYSNTQTSAQSAATDLTTDTATDTSTTSDPAGQAAAVTAILTQARSARGAVVSAVKDAAACGDLAGDLSALQTAEQSRKDLAAQADALSVDALDNASAVPGLLSTALTDSATADSYFVSWVQDLQQSCSPATASSDANYSAAGSASQTAETDKQNLLGTWNPIAAQYSQPTWSTSDI